MTSPKSIPQLKPQGLVQARSAATVARRKRADLKAQLRDGQISLGQAIEQAKSDPVLAQIRVQDLLKALPRVGDRRAMLLIESVGIAANRRVRGLGRLQIAGLKAEFGER